MSQLYKIRGYLHSKTPAITIKTKSDKDFVKAEFVLNTIDQNGQFVNENYINFEISGDKIQQLEAIEKGNEIDVDFFINGRLYTSKDGLEKSFTSLKAIKIVV